MATTDEINMLRDLVNDNAAPQTFTAAQLSGYIDAEGDVRKAAGVVWGIKASRLAGLVDVTEGSSSRKMSQLYKQALEMSAHFGGEDSVATTGRSGTRRIVRPT